MERLKAARDWNAEGKTEDETVLLAHGYRALSKRLLLGMPKAVFGGAKDCFWVGKTVLLRIRQKKDKKTANQEMTLNVTEGTGLTIITASET